ncbi:hypothetical protein DITRI_Ditri15bG0028500 [Diplodiscus trichospermus]
MGCKNGTRFFVPVFFTVVILALNFMETSGQFDSPSASVPDTNSSEGSLSDDTVRVDPLDGFKKYRGGFDVSNKHYWSSVIFTGVYGYAIALLWLLCGIIYGGYLLATAHCCKRKGKPKTKSICHKQCYFWPILLAIIFTIMAIAASGLALGVTARFHSKAKTVVRIIIRTANEASETIYNTTGAMRGIRDNLEETNGTGEITSIPFSTSEATGFLNSTSQTLDDEATNIARQARKNRRLIDTALKIAFIISTVIISLNLVAVIALSATGIFRIRRALYWLIAVCWVMTVLCWAFFGIYYCLGKFAGDACTAFENFQENPYNNTLSSILPCDELLSAEPVLSEVSAGIYNLVNEVNSNISQQQGTSSNLPLICNPFSAPPAYTYQPDNCSANTIKIADIPRILSAFACSDSSNGTCQGGLISASDYRTVEAYTTSIQNLLNSYPGMESILACQPVKDAFSLILREHCSPLKRLARISWASMVVLSIVMVVLVLIWTAKARHDQQLHSLDGSVKPDHQSSTRSSSELLENNEVIKDNHSSNPNSV